MSAASDHISFDRFRFDVGTARLFDADREVKLTRKASAVLAILIRAGRPVSKDELFTTVWSNTVVSDDALTTCIQEIRKALGDDAKQPRFIETRHRLGYQFVAKLLNVDNSTDLDASAIAVLPFVDMSPERDQDFFCEGLAEELIDALTHVDGLRVVARTSSFQFRGGVDVREAGRRLGAGSLLEGSVRKSNERLRVTVQLIDVKSGFHHWSQKFERPLGDVFAMQDEIAEAVAKTLRGGTLSNREKSGLRRQHTASEPYEYYLRGRQRLHRMQAHELEESRQMFERAIQLDAKYAPAWAGLTAVHATLYEWFGARETDLDRAEHASEVAMELAPDLADAHVARGFALTLRRRYDEAARHFDKAEQINPNLFDAYYYHGRMEFGRGDIPRSAELFRKASEVRREDFQSLYLAGQSLRMAGRVAEADTLNRESIVRAERILALNPNDARTLSLGAGAYQADGQEERAMELTARSLELYPNDMGALFNATCVYCTSGLLDKALDTLERAINQGFGRRDWIEHDTDYDALREHPRFKELMKKLK